MDTKKLKLYAKDGLNVLLSGKHGVGKTAVVKEVFDELFGEHGKDWFYYSASTIDPWVDFIGIPKSYTRPDGKEVFTIIPPEHFSGDEQVKAIFFDEINRADPKVLNATMELIQFKSINGRKFPHLKCVWAAENPADDADAEYSVKPLDPAQKDRFNIQLNFPEVLNKEYFLSKYDKKLFEIAKEWWAPNKNKISPRKLDDILLGFTRGYDINDFSNTVRLDELKFSLENSSVYETMLDVAKNSTEEEKAKYFSLDRIRKYSKIIQSNAPRGGNSDELLKEIYECLDDEVKAYVKNTFKYVPKNKLAPRMSERAQDFLYGYKKREPNRNFICSYYPIGTSTTISYMNKLVREVAPIDLIPNNDYSGFYFPFSYDTNAYNTHTIRDFVAVLNGVDNPDLVRGWFARSVFMLHTFIMDNPADHNCYKTIKKLAGNKDFIKYIGLNKIFFNEIMKMKKHYTYQEVEKRLFTK